MPGILLLMKCIPSCHQILNNKLSYYNGIIDSSSSTVKKKIQYICILLYIPSTLHCKQANIKAIINRVLTYPALALSTCKYSFGLQLKERCGNSSINSYV